MRKILFGILIFCLLFPGLPGYAAPDEGFGEDHGALGQFVDTFDTDGNISTNVNVIRNTTLEVMELNQTTVSGNETFTAYTEVDTNNKIIVFGDRIEFVTLRRDDEGYVYYDYGVNFFGDFQVEFNVVINDTEAGDSDQRWIASTVAFTTYVDDYVGGSPGDDCMFVMIRDNAAVDNTYKFSIFGLDGGAVLPGVEDIGKIRAVSNTELYLTFNRTDDDFYLWVYTDSARTVLDESLTLPNTGMAELLRYSYGVQTIDSDNDGEIWMSGYVKDLWLGGGPGGYSPSGYFTTTNYLNDTFANGTTLALQTISTIPANTEIKVQFSNDSSVWRNNLGVIGSGNVLTTGFGSIDMRELNYTVAYFRFNESTSSNLITPMLNQSKVITTIGAGVGGGVIARPTMLIVGGLLTIVIAVVIGVKKR